MSEFPDAELVDLIRQLFRDPDRGLAVVGAGGAAFSARARKRPLDREIPALERLGMYQLELRGQLELLAAQVSEFEGADLDRLEAEGVAVLVAMRELRRHFPELDA